MRIVLHESIQGLGNRGDIVDVADGYARNSLIPKGLAQQASAGVEAQADAMKKAWQVKNAKDREAAEEIAQSLVARAVVVPAKAGAEGKLFGSVTAADIASAVQEQTNIELDRKMIQLEEPIRTVGAHPVQVRLRSDVEFPVTITVVEE